MLAPTPNQHLEGVIAACLSCGATQLMFIPAVRDVEVYWAKLSCRRCQDLTAHEWSRPNGAYQRGELG